MVEEKTNVVGKVRVTHEITEQQFSGILTTAFEGGINYWCTSIRATKTDPAIPEQEFFAEDVASGHVLEMSIHDNEGGKQYLISREQLIKAFQTMERKHPRHFRDFIEDNSDADTADVWFQCAVFGDSIYG